VNKTVPPDHDGHRSHMAADFCKRLWISRILTLPILIVSPMLQTLSARVLKVKRVSDGQP